MSRVEAEPIRFTFHPSLLAEKRLAHAAFLADRDRAQDELWAQIAADRAARKHAHQWMETRT